MNLTQPPSRIFKEYVWTGPWQNAEGWQRVTDPQATHPGAHEFLPNPVNRIQIDDLEAAIYVEMQIEQWGGHAGTSGKAVRVNDSPWIPIPESATMGPEPPEAYQYFRYPTIRVPLAWIRQGENRFEFTSGPQIAHDFGWGQWGVYGVIFRVYYDDVRTHPSGAILSPTSGTSLGERVTIDVAVNEGGAPVAAVDVAGYYTDFDRCGDGVYRRWHFHTRYGKPMGHIGTATQAPWSVQWTTSWLPDQGEPIRLVARITDVEGVSFLTPVVEGLRLGPRPFQVRLHTPYDVPAAWQTRAGQIHACRVDIPQGLQPEDAKLLMATWCGASVDEIGINGTVVARTIGRDHDYSYDEIALSPSLLRPGPNRLYTTASTEHHGIEVLWPGIGVKSRTPAK